MITMRHLPRLLLGVVLAVAARADAAWPTVRHLPGARPDVSGFVFTSAQGVRVFVDAVAIPEDLAAAYQDPRSVFLVTGRQPDHLSEKLAEGFKGQKLVAAPGRLESGDVRVEGIASSRTGDQADGSDVLMVVELGGVRVAHFGDCGQSALSADQLRRVGHLDLLVLAFDRPYTDAELRSRREFRDRGYSDSGPVNRQPFKLVAQVRPTLVVPTHLSSSAAAGLLARVHPAEAARKTELTLSPEVLARGPRVVFTAANADLARQAGIAPSTEL
jgi:hypothetical protein